jgi:hypothetical protein
MFPVNLRSVVARRDHEPTDKENPMHDDITTAPMQIPAGVSAPRRTRTPIAAALAVTAAAALAVAAVGVVLVTTDAEASTTADLGPSPVAPQPAEELDPVVAPVLDPVADPADSYEADPPDLLAITDFSVSNTQVLCNTESPVYIPQQISFSWDVTGAEQVFFGVDTTDAQAAPMFTDLPHAGDSHTGFPAGYEDFAYSCPVPSHTYTLTAVDEGGHAVSKTVTVINNGDTTF